MKRTDVERWQREMSGKSGYDMGAEDVDDLIRAFGRLIEDWLCREWAMRESVSKLRYYKDCAPEALPSKEGR